MVLYTGAGHQRIIIFSLFCLQLCLPLLVHFPRRAARSRPARRACRLLFVHRQCNTAAREPACNTHLLFTLFGPLGRREVRCRWELGQLGKARCRASREPGCIAGLLFIRLELRISSCTLNSELASASRGWATWRRPLGATRVTTCYDA